MLRPITISLLAGACLLCATCKKDPVKIISINPTEFTTEDQIKIGDAFQSAIEQNPDDFPILDREAHEEAWRYVGTLYQTLLNTSPVAHRLKYDWTLHIVHDDSMRTAYFLPGGHLYLYTGLLKFLDSESQLLGVIGHEMHYADTDVMVKQMGKEFGGTKLGDILLDNPVPQLGEFAAAMPALKFSESDVLRADAFALQLICPFQYEPVAIKHILEKAEDSSLTFQWAENRNADSHIRVERIEEKAIECGLPGVSNEVSYRYFKENLLP